MTDKAAADVSGCMITVVVAIVIIRCKTINKQLNAQSFISFLHNQVSKYKFLPITLAALSKAWFCNP